MNTATRTLLPDDRPAVVLAGTPDFDAELEALRLSRRRQALILFLGCYVLFLLRDLASDPGPIRDAQLKILAAAAALQSLLVAVSRTRAFVPFAEASEWLNLFGFAAVAGGAQYLSVTDPAMIAVFAASADMQILFANTSMMPYFAVIAGYPALVPHATRWTVAIVSFTAAVPVAVTAAAMALTPELTANLVKWMFAQFVVWGAIGVWIAAYTARQAGRLRAEVFEARRFGQYVLKAKIGAGGMGEVHLAEHRLLKRPSVIKLIRRDRAKDPKMLARFEREVRMLSTLTHWNTVEVYDYGHTPDGTFYFVMEYLPGLNLEQLVAQYGPLPPGRAVFLLRQVCRGLREAHAVGLIHRDIKPGNIMAVNRGGTPDLAKLLDFGLVAAPDDADSKLTREGAVLGTPLFASPEQASGQPADARSDVYSVGCTLYYLLTGKPPFAGKNAVATLAAHLTEPPPALPGVPGDLAAVAAACLAKAPGARYAGAKELEAALGACGCAAEWDEDRAAAWWAGK